MTLLVVGFVFVSVLFNEPKLLKSEIAAILHRVVRCFSALQRAEIAEMYLGDQRLQRGNLFQCSSTSRNC